MTKHLVLALIVCLLAGVAGAQTFLNGPAVFTYPTMDAATVAAGTILTDQTARAEVLPMRMMHAGVADEMTAMLIIQPTDYQFGACVSDANQSTLPVQSWIGTGHDAPIGCTITLGGYHATTFDNFYNAYAAYRILFPQYRATSLILATNADNGKWVLLTQVGNVTCP